MSHRIGLRSSLAILDDTIMSNVNLFKICILQRCIPGVCTISFVKISFCVNLGRYFIFTTFCLHFKFVILVAIIKTGEEIQLTGTIKRTRKTGCFTQVIHLLST